MSEFWVPWIGMPFIEGADPRAGVGACCFRMAQAIREELALPWPRARMAEWYDRAAAGDWAALREDWSASTVACPRLPGAIILLDREPPPGAFGVGTLVSDRMMLTCLHSKGVVAVPRSVWKDWEFREPLS